MRPNQDFVQATKKILQFFFFWHLYTVRSHFLHTSVEKCIFDQGCCCCICACITARSSCICRISASFSCRIRSFSDTGLFFSDSGRLRIKKNIEILRTQKSKFIRISRLRLTSGRHRSSFCQSFATIIFIMYVLCYFL